MSCYNQCKECSKNSNDYCIAKKMAIDYFMDTSRCLYFEEKVEDMQKIVDANEKLLKELKDGKN